MRTLAGRFVLAVVICIAALGASESAFASHDAVLLQTGGKGLYSYNCWTGARRLAIKGLSLSTVQARSFAFGPGRHAIVLEGTHRSDGAGETEELRIARYPVGKAYLVFKGTAGELLGWTDTYHAVVQVQDSSYRPHDYLVDARTGKKTAYHGGKPKYGPEAKRKATYGERRYSARVDDQGSVTVKLKSTGHLYAKFRAPGMDGDSDWWTMGEPAISPDGHFLSFENASMPYGDSRVLREVWTCAIDGTKARKMKYSTGLMLWR